MNSRRLISAIIRSAVLGGIVLLITTIYYLNTTGNQGEISLWTPNDLNRSDEDRVSRVSLYRMQFALDQVRVTSVYKEIEEHGYPFRSTLGDQDIAIEDKDALASWFKEQTALMIEINEKLSEQGERPEQFNEALLEYGKLLGIELPSPR